MKFTEAIAALGAMRCADCRWWSRLYDASWGTCKCDPADKPLRAYLYGYDDDRKDITSSVETHESYGCVKFETKEQS